MLDHVKAFKPDLIGLNTVSPLIYDTVECVSLINSVWDGPVIAGGHHATALPAETLLHINGLTGVVSGEGEIVMTRLASGEAPETIPGLWWRKGEGFVHTPPEQIADLDQLPLPALNLLDMEFYTQRSTHAISGCYRRVICMVTSRGCYNHCSFCSESLTYGRSVRFHSPAYVVSGIKEYLKDYPAVDAIYFHDNDFLADPARARMICEQMIAAGLPKNFGFAIQARTSRINPTILKLLKRAGCIKIEFGIETTIQKQLDRIGKNTANGINECAVYMCKQVGIPVHAYMLYGLEDETYEDLNSQLCWIKKTNPATFSLSRIKLHPGTMLYQQYGQFFFERNEWTASAVQHFYQTLLPSSIAPQQRASWIKKKALPHLFIKKFLSIFKLNPSCYWGYLVLSQVASIYNHIRGRLAKAVVDK